MHEHTPIREKMLSDESISECIYDSKNNELHVYHTGSVGHSFAEEEVNAIMAGKLEPATFNENVIVYDVNITLDEQREQRSSKFTFSA